MMNQETKLAYAKNGHQGHVDEYDYVELLHESENRFVTGEDETNVMAGARDGIVESLGFNEIYINGELYKLFDIFKDTDDRFWVEKEIL